MTGQLGMIPDEVDELATQLDGKAGDLDTVLTTLTTKLQSTTWVGADYNRFEEQWTGTIAQNLRNAAEQMRTAASAAREDAENQRIASS
ncbi:hypothetical protein FB562_0619 [Homoserinimonas aerilata]|uniref:WXG100 family type VII secretion target n=1 Tax=Homoserinimonas aerilata TaxID=1162970 RepID=A0A542YHU6_9MICO|nr:hypothetical protein [Homoserinimonas aerilata]TQL47554.1 hypothetical protein FB562_0619 [Homoserinimonas aerilata]